MKALKKDQCSPLAPPKIISGSNYIGGEEKQNSNLHYAKLSVLIMVFYMRGKLIFS